MIAHFLSLLTLLISAHSAFASPSKLPVVSPDTFFIGQTFEWNRVSLEKPQPKIFEMFRYVVADKKDSKVAFYVDRKTQQDDTFQRLALFVADIDVCIASHTDNPAPVMTLYWYELINKKWVARGENYITEDFEAYFNCDPNTYASKSGVQIVQQNLKHSQLGSLDIIKRTYNGWEPSYLGGWHIQDHPKLNGVSAVRSWYLHGMSYQDQLVSVR